MIPDNITKAHLEKAIEEIDKKGITKGRHSSTYDVVYKGKSYPPKLVISIANRFANGEELDSKNFSGGKNTQAFQLLKKEGFHIELKDGTTMEEFEQEEDFSIVVSDFLKQAKEGGLKTKDYPKSYRDLKVKVSFGQGVAARIPWIAIYKQPNKVSDGIYPVFLYYKEIDKLILAYGISETSIPSQNWGVSNLNTISNWYKESFNSKPDRYGSSYIKNIYDVNNIDINQVNMDLEEIIETYKDILDKNQNTNNELYLDDEAKNYIYYLRKIVKSLGLNKNDERIVFSVRDNSLNFIIGQRYSFNFFTKKTKGSYGVISKVKLNETGEPYEGISPQPFYNYYNEFNPTKSDWDFIIDSMKDELNRTVKSSFNKHNDFNFEDYVYTSIDESKQTNNNMNFSLNTILYGPPGTGKTYNTILRAAQIIEKREITSYNEALEIFKKNLHERIEFITFHQNYSYEDFIQGLRPETDNKSSLVFDKKDGVFKEIADKALGNIRLSEKAPSELSREARFNIALEKFQDIIIENEDNYAINDTAFIFEIEEDAFRYTGEKWKNHTSGLRMKFSDLKEFYRNDVKNRKDIKKLTSISGLANQHATYYFLVYDQIIKQLPEEVEITNKVEELNYVIIIDEINRANISRVFGELITLIEPDKRSHGSIPLEARLPSGDPFIVPSNLHIIGTMNTADKSIALLDIALRRRFEFESMYPQYEIEGQEIYDVDILKKINEQIIKSKGHDFQIGHAYFMGDNNDLVERINKKVIPLLLEYYMNDEKEVKSILQSAGLIIKVDTFPMKITGKK